MKAIFTYNGLNNTKSTPHAMDNLWLNFHVIRLEEVSRVGAPISPLVIPPPPLYQGGMGMVLPTYEWLGTYLSPALRTLS